MPFSVESITSFVPLLTVMLTGGLVAGFLAGLLGVGGGAILVPILYEAFSYTGVEEGIRMHLALGTSFAVIAPTSMRSAFAHWKKSSMDTSLIMRLGPWVSLGAVCGVGIAGYVHGESLIWIWIFGSSVMAVKMTLGQRDYRLRDSLPEGKGLETTAFLIGLISALLSIGGGMFFVPLLTLFSMPILSAVATSSGFGPMIALPCVFGYMLAGFWGEGLPLFSIGYVNLLAAALIIPTSLYAVTWGVKLAHSLSHRGLELFFAVYLIGVSLNFLKKLL